MSYYGEQWYVPTTVPITITYYTYKIRIGANESSFIGQDYQKVEEKLKKAGFTNIQKQEVSDGWEKNNSVVSLLVSNSAEYEETASYSPDTKILIKYSAGERVDVTDLLKKWDTIKANTLKESFEQKGFSDVSVQDEPTTEKSKNKLVSEVIFNDKSYESGDCYLPKGTKIVIKRYILNLSAGRNSGDYIGKNYHDVANELKEKGFTNIHLLRADDLWIAEWDDCKVKSITIDGKSSFSVSDKFTFNDRIDIVVHTYKWLDYSDIAEKAS